MKELEIGQKYYRVQSYGALMEYEVSGFKNGVPVYSIAGLTDLSNETYKFKDNPLNFGSSTFPLQTILSDNKNEWFSDINDAKKVSLERFTMEVNPNGIYRVARYFDDVFECYVTDEISKKEAKGKCDELNKRQRHYVSYSIVAIKKALGGEDE